MAGHVFIATSLDGYISRTDGSIDWLMKANEQIPDGEDCGYAEFMAGIDAIVIGRHTFEMVLTFGEWLYGKMPIIVMSQTLKALPAGLPDTVSLSRETPAELEKRLKSEGINQLYIDGGKTIQGFLQAGLIEEIHITLIPVLLGSGRPLFGPLAAEAHWQLVSSRQYDFGFVQNHYKLLSPLNG